MSIVWLTVQHVLLAAMSKTQMQLKQSTALHVSGLTEQY